MLFLQLTSPFLYSYERSFLGTRLLYEYNVFKIAEQDEEQLYADENPFALAVLVAKAAFAGKNIESRRERDNVLLETKRRLMHAMLSRDIPKDKIRSLIIFLTYYINFEFKETNAMPSPYWGAFILLYIANISD